MLLSSECSGRAGKQEGHRGKSEAMSPNGKLPQGSLPFLKILAESQIIFAKSRREHTHSRLSLEDKIEQ